MNSTSRKKVLITGATGSLGKVALKKYLSEGFEVVGTYTHTPPNQQEFKGQVEWLQVDLTQPQKVKEKLSGKKFDIIVHCAGGFRFSKVEQLADADLDFLINTNLKSAFYLVRELLPPMIEQNFGRIVFVSSKATFQPGVGMAAYAASKAGLNMLVTSLAEEVKKYNITVNAVLPSVIDTSTNRKDMPNAQFSDWVSSEKLVDIIFSITSEWGSPIHGALMPIAGRV